jgi:hypothetical protein
MVPADTNRLLKPPEFYSKEDSSATKGSNKNRHCPFVVILSDKICKKMSVVFRHFVFVVLGILGKFCTTVLHSKPLFLADEESLPCDSIQRLDRRSFGLQV